MDGPVVELQSGLARGVVERHEDGFDYYAFRGIPYAEPPVGELRFQDPVPIKKWSGIVDCKDYGPRCLQCDFVLKLNFFSEDCLHLNVFTRSIEKSNAMRPVMLIVHAGMFVFGSSDDTLYGPEYLIRKDLVLVTVNYRLGVLGFLNLEDEVAPGNQGLRDLILALQWVQENVQVFGGDAKNVTLFGAGSGATIAHALALASQTRGLFHKVISLGNSLFNSWINIKNPKSNAMKLCSLLGKELTDSREILEFLKTIDPKSLQEAQERLRIALTDSLPFSLGVDSKSSDPLIPVHQYAAAEQGVHLPYLISYCARDGIVLLTDDVFHPEMSSEAFFEACNEDFRECCRFNGMEIAERYGLTLEQTRRLYFKSELLSERTLGQFVDCATDIYFVEGVHKLARAQSERSSAPTYLYKFSYESRRSLLKYFLKDGPAGATHLDDLPFLFKMRAFEVLGYEHFEKGSREYTLMEQMTEMYANFAKHGRPTIDTAGLVPVHWKPVADGTVLRHLNVDEDITMQLTVNVDQKLLAARDIKV